jgi:hypothetical protein
VVVRRGQFRRTGWVINTLEAQVGQFLLGRKCPVSRFLPGRAKDLSATLYSVFSCSIPLLPLINLLSTSLTPSLLPPDVTVIKLHRYAFRWHSLEPKAATYIKNVQTTTAFERRNVSMQLGNMHNRNQPPNLLVYGLM